MSTDTDEKEVCANCGFENGGIDECMCEPADCIACQGFGAREIAGSKETEWCETCEGEGIFYPPRIPEREYMKTKGYS
jgi:hypothetical protein